MKQNMQEEREKNQKKGIIRVKAVTCYYCAGGTGSALGRSSDVHSGTDYECTENMLLKESFAVVGCYAACVASLPTLPEDKLQIGRKPEISRSDALSTDVTTSAPTPCRLQLPNSG
jgi:hypothetical protein